MPAKPASGSSTPAPKPAPGSSTPAPKPAAPAPKPGASPAPKPPKLGPTTPPANDDRRSIGELRAALNFRPSGTITVMTALSIIAWTGLWTLYVYFHRESILATDGNFLAPTPILTLLALFGPIVFLFVTGVMARRAHEMRLVAKAMTEAAIRLIEPETVATEQVVSLSQAIRREAASMGDGIERALARAGELEVIVRTEVTNLERSYSENERRIRLLIDELAHEREAIILNADNARTSLYGARDSLASEVASASAHLAEQVSAAGNRVTAALGSKGEEVRLALESAGDGLERTVLRPWRPARRDAGANRRRRRAKDRRGDRRRGAALRQGRRRYRDRASPSSATRCRAASTIIAPAWSSASRRLACDCRKPSAARTIVSRRGSPM